MFFLCEYRMILTVLKTKITGNQSTGNNPWWDVFVKCGQGHQPKILLV